MSLIAIAGQLDGYAGAESRVMAGLFVSTYPIFHASNVIFVEVGVNQS